MPGSDVNEGLVTTSFRREQLWTAGTLALVLGITFYILDWNNARGFAGGAPLWDITLSWDALIPFRPEWIWMYLLYFPVCFLPLLFPEVRDRIGIFRQTAIGYAAQFFLAFPLFALLPLRMIRPDIVPATLSESAVAWLYGFEFSAELLEA